MGCVSHTGYFAYENSNGEARGRIKHKNNSKRVVRNMEELNEGTEEKSPKQGLTSVEDLTIKLPDFPYHRLE